MSPGLIISLTFNVMLAGCLVAVCVAVSRRLSAMQQQLDKHMGALRSEITAVSRGAVGLGKRVKQVQESLVDTQRRQEELEYKDVGDVAITHASKLAQMGADSAELVSTCGLSKAEASLMTLMHSRHKEGARNAA